MEFLSPRWWDYILACVVLLAILAFGGVLLAGCSCQPGYVAADKLTFQAVTPEYLDYVRGDEGLSRLEVLRRERTIDSWEARIKEVERDD